MKEYLLELIDRKNLSRTQTYDLLSKLLEAPLEQQAAILALFSAKKECVEEILGSRDFFLEHSMKVDCPYDAIDLAGTGGDAIGTFNISTAASLVIASCGIHVAKHGGRNATSKSGSTDVLESLKIQLSNNPKEVLSSLKSNKFAYLSGPLFNPLLKHFRCLKKNIGIPNIFNIICPLLNPTQLKRQVIGVYSKDLLMSIATVLKASGSNHVLVVHSEDGLDEISISAHTYCRIKRWKNI